MMVDNNNNNNNNDKAYFEPGELYVVVDRPVYFFINENFKISIYDNNIKDMFVKPGEMIVFIKEEEMFKELHEEYNEQTYNENINTESNSSNKIGIFLYKNKLIYAIDWNSKIFPLKKQLVKVI